MKHLLVTNDFPPKIGGIQSYLWELWRRLDPASFVVYTTPHAGAGPWDAEQPFEVVRSKYPWLTPIPQVIADVERLIVAHQIDMVVLDPALPLGLIGPKLSVPYVTVVHGAEVTVPGRLVGSRQLLGSQLAGSTSIIAAGQYVADEAHRAIGARPVPSTLIIPPGVDTELYSPPTHKQRVQARREWGIADDMLVVGSLSRLVPRKGMDHLIRAVHRLSLTGRRVEGLIAGAGRDTKRLRSLIQETGAPVRLVGRIPDDRKTSFYWSLDVFAMLCRNRWAGLEQEGFGIVFGEAMSCGLPCVAGASGGAAEAVADHVSGLVVAHPDRTYDVTVALGRLLDSAQLRETYGAAGRQRALDLFDYHYLAGQLAAALQTTPVR